MNSLRALCTLLFVSVPVLAGSEAPGALRLTLDEAVQLALRQNPQIEKSRQEIERTRGVVIEVRAQALPQVSSTATYNQQDPALLEGSFGGGGSSSMLGGGAAGVDGTAQGELAAGQQQGGSTATDTNQPGADQSGGAANFEQGEAQGGQQGGSFSVQDKSWRVAFEVRQVIYAGGQVRAALKIAKFTGDSAYFQLRDTVDQVIATTRTQFYTILLNRQLIEVQRQSVALLEDELEDQRNRFEAGTVPKFNVLRAEVELANQRPVLIRARNDYVVAQLRLAKTLAIDYDRTVAGRPPIEAVGALESASVVPPLAAALAVAVERRPFLKVQRQQMLIEVQRIKVAIAGYKPRVSANGGYEFRNSRFSDDLTETVNGWFFGVTGTWDIFDGFETYGQVKQAKARLESAKVNYEDSTQQVALEVQQVWYQLQEAVETIESQQKNVEQATEALRLARERLDAGAGTQLDVLDARVALTRARVTELQARFDYNSARAEFDRVTATGTQVAETFDDPVVKRARAKAEKSRE